MLRMLESHRAKLGKQDLHQVFCMTSYTAGLCDVICEQARWSLSSSKVTALNPQISKTYSVTFIISERGHVYCREYQHLDTCIVVNTNILTRGPTWSYHQTWDPRLSQSNIQR